MFHDSSWSRNGSGGSLGIDDENDAFDNIVILLEGLWLSRSCITCAHGGDMLANMDGTSEEATKNWSDLRATAYEKNGMAKKITYGRVSHRVRPTQSDIRTLTAQSSAYSPY